MARPNGLPEPPGLKEAEQGISRILDLPNTVIAQIERTVHQGMDRLPERVPPPLRRILFESKHDSFLEALLSDVVEAHPLGALVLKPFRLRSTAKEGQGQVETISRHAIDLALPIPLPANIRRYLRERLGM